MRKTPDGHMTIPSSYKQPTIKCITCKNLLCYKSFIVHKYDKCTKFSALFNYAVEELDSMSIIGVKCILCEGYIGLKYDKEFYLMNTSFTLDEYKICLKIFSLDEECIEQFKELVLEANKDLNLKIDFSQEI